MTKAQHTPGPWLSNERGAIETRDRVICRVMDGHTTRAIIESMANARLIAAAPEMLAMLKRIFKVMPSRMEEGGQLLEGEIAALIAKATGE